MKIEPKITWKDNVPVTKTPETNVLVFLRSESNRVELTAQLKPIEGVSFQMHLQASPAAVAMLRGSQAVNLVLADIDVINPDDLEFIRQLKTNAFGVPVVALVERGSEAAAVRAFRAGADDVLLKPVDIEEAREIFTRIGKAPELINKDNSKLGGAIAFIHVTGGAGATTLAVNSASLLADRRGDGETCLLDFDIQYGNAASLLDLSALSPIAELFDDPGRLDREMLEGMMIKYGTNLRVLTAPRHPFPLNAYSSETIRRIMDIAKRRFSHVVVDLPVALAPWTDVVLREAEFIYMVCTPSVASVHRLAQFISLLETEELADLPIKIVLNRHSSLNKGADISVAEFEKAIGRRVAHVIGNDYPLISASHGQGRPAVQLKPEGKFATQLGKMLSEDLRFEDAQPGRKWRWPFGNA